MSLAFSGILQIVTYQDCPLDLDTMPSPNCPPLTIDATNNTIINPVLVNGKRVDIDKKKNKKYHNK